VPSAALRAYHPHERNQEVVDVVSSGRLQLSPDQNWQATWGLWLRTARLAESGDSPMTWQAAAQPS